MREDVKTAEQITIGAAMNAFSEIRVPLQRASALIEHRSADGILLSSETVYNVITNVGRVQYHAQCFSASPGANGFNYIGLSNDALTEDATSTTLSNEIATNGLTRAQGAVVLASGSGNQTTITKVFTASGAQSARKAALFNASSNGVINHILAFTQRALQIGDTISVVFTITLG